MLWRLIHLEPVTHYIYGTLRALFVLRSTLCGEILQFHSTVYSENVRTSIEMTCLRSPVLREARCRRFGQWFFFTDGDTADSLWANLDSSLPCQYPDLRQNLCLIPLCLIIGACVKSGQRTGISDEQHLPPLSSASSSPGVSFCRDSEEEEEGGNGGWSAEF